MTQTGETRIRIIEVKQSVFENNNKEADALREELSEKGIFLLNVMSSPGAGKTTFLKEIIKKCNGKVNIGVIEADIDSDVDARAISETGAVCVQVHTGGMCHLDAGMTRAGVEALQREADALDKKIDIAILENVGNLVCPAEFDTGAHASIEILSVPEGDDKPLKYPLMFQVTDAVVVSKIDVMPYFDFDLEKLKHNVQVRKPQTPVFALSAKTGDGLEIFIDWLTERSKNA